MQSRRVKHDRVTTGRIASGTSAGPVREARAGVREPRTVVELVQTSLPLLTSAERRVARSLLASYPIASLETVARLAERAGVSGPTVVRFINKIGYASYTDFQNDVRNEVQARFASPLRLYDQHPQPRSQHAILASSHEVFADGLQKTFASLPESEFEAVVGLLANERSSVHCLGGRFSQILAYYLVAHLNLLRPGVRLLGTGIAPVWDQLVDVRKKDVFVLFDYRRYQQDSIEIAHRVARGGSIIVLFTDPWLSPVAAVAHHVLTARVDAPSPFDSLVAALALVEAVVAGTAEVVGKVGKDRIVKLDTLRVGVTWDEERTDGALGCRERDPESRRRRVRRAPSVPGEERS